MDKDTDVKISHEEKLFLDYVYTVDLKQKPGRNFSDFKPSDPSFWIRYANQLCDGNFQQNLIETLFINLENTPYFTDENCRIATTIQMQLQQAFKNEILSQTKNTINQYLQPYNSLDPLHVTQINSAARSFSYEVILSLQAAYDKKNNQKGLSIETLQNKAIIKKEFMKLFLAANSMLDTPANLAVDISNLNFDKIYNELKKNIWDKFNSYINIRLPSGKMTFTDPADTDEALLVQALQSIMQTDEYKELGSDKAIEALVTELNKSENQDKKNIIHTACNNLKKNQKKLFNRGKEAKTILNSPALQKCFQSLSFKLSNPISTKLQTQLEKPEAIAEQLSTDSEEPISTDDGSDTEMSNIDHDDDSREEPGENTEHARTSNHEILQDIWEKTWKDKKPKSSMGRFLKAMGPSSAKEDITHILSSPLSKSRYEKLSDLILRLDEKSDYTQLYQLTQEFMTNPFINSKNIPEKCYRGLKKFQMVLDYFIFSQALDAQKKTLEQSQLTNPQSIFKTYSKETTSHFDAESLESLSLSSPRSPQQDIVSILPLEQLLKDIREQVDIFLTHSKNNQDGNERHTGLRLIQSFSQNNPATTRSDNDAALFYAQVRAIADYRLDASGLFTDLFKKRLGRHPLVQEFYIAFKQTPLTALNDQQQLETNEIQLKTLLQKLVNLNTKIFDPKKAAEILKKTTSMHHS